METRKAVSGTVAWMIFLLVAVFVGWVANTQFDKEFPPQVTFSVGTTEIRIVDKDVNRLRRLVTIAEGAQWQRYPAERVEVLCELMPAKEWYRVQCKLSGDAQLIVDEELQSRVAVKEFFWSLYHDSTRAAPVTPVLSSKTIEA